MTTSHFDQIAAHWDEKPSRLDMARRQVAVYLERFEWRPDMRLLDFGCGTGLFSLALRASSTSASSVRS